MNDIFVYLARLYSHPLFARKHFFDRHSEKVWKLSATAMGYQRHATQEHAGRRSRLLRKWVLS